MAHFFKALDQLLNIVIFVNTAHIAEDERRSIVYRIEVPDTPIVTNVVLILPIKVVHTK